jgi:hypothetical protein
MAGLAIEDDGGLQILRRLSRSWNSRGDAAHAIAPPATMAPFSECYLSHVIREELIALRGIHENCLFSGMDNGGLVRQNCAVCSALCASPLGRPWKGVLCRDRIDCHRKWHGRESVRRVKVTAFDSPLSSEYMDVRTARPDEEYPLKHT